MNIYNPQSVAPHCRRLYVRRRYVRLAEYAPMFAVEIDREKDGRWFAEVPELPGVMAYGHSRDEAVARTEALALQVLAEQQEQRAVGGIARRRRWFDLLLL